MWQNSVNFLHCEIAQIIMFPKPEITPLDSNVCENFEAFLFKEDDRYFKYIICAIKLASIANFPDVTSSILTKFPT